MVLGLSCLRVLESLYFFGFRASGSSFVSVQYLCVLGSQVSERSKALGSLRFGVLGLLVLWVKGFGLL